MVDGVVEDEVVDGVVVDVVVVELGVAPVVAEVDGVVVVVDGAVVVDVVVVDGGVEPVVVAGADDDGPVIAVDVVDVLDGVVAVDGVVVVLDDVVVVDGVVVVAGVVDVVVVVVVDGLPAAAFLSASLILPQMSCAVSFGSVLLAVASAGLVVDVALLVGGVVAVVDGVAGVVVVAVDEVVGLAVVPVFASSSFSLACSSATSDCFKVSRRASLVLMSSSSLTRDFSSPTSCSRLASDSFVRARSPRAPLLPVPEAGPG